MKPCGICDNCLQRKNSTLSTEEFAQISEGILSHLNRDSLEITILLDKLSSFKKDSIWHVLNFLQSEGKVRVNKQGKIEPRV